MSVATPPAAAVARPRARGRTTVAPRAIDRTVAAVAAEFFGVAARSVQVELSDRGGLLALLVRTPVRAVSLARVRQTPALVEMDGTLRERAAEGQLVIQQRVTALTGAAVAHVTVEVTGIHTVQEKRVQ